jgi:hypothetical protein
VRGMREASQLGAHSPHGLVEVRLCRATAVRLEERGWRREDGNATHQQLCWVRVHGISCRRQRLVLPQQRLAHQRARFRVALRVAPSQRPNFTVLTTTAH